MQFRNFKKVIVFIIQTIKKKREKRKEKRKRRRLSCLIGEKWTTFPVNYAFICCICRMVKGQENPLNIFYSRDLIIMI